MLFAHVVKLARMIAFSDADDESDTIQFLKVLIPNFLKKECRIFSKTLCK